MREITLAAVGNRALRVPLQFPLSQNLRSLSHLFRKNREPIFLIPPPFS